jgi:hypothetical protein
MVVIGGACENRQTAVGGARSRAALYTSSSSDHESSSLESEALEALEEYEIYDPDIATDQTTGTQRP